MHGVKYELVHGAAVAETHLGFRRVDVDVDCRRIDFEEDAISREATAMQHVLIGLAQRVAEQFVADEAAIDVAILGVAACARVGGQRALAEDADAGADASIDGA